MTGLSLLLHIFDITWTTVMIPSFQTDMSGQTVQNPPDQTEEQSDKGLHSLPFHLYFNDIYTPMV